MSADHDSTDSPSVVPATGSPTRSHLLSVDRVVLACIEAGVVLSLKDDRLSVKAPKDADISTVLDDLRERREEVEEFLRNDVEAERRIAMGPVRHPDNDSVVSGGQERLWFIFQLEEDKSTYNMFGAFEITGDFNYQALDSALQAIMFRHQVFRTHIENYDGELVNKTTPISRVHVPVDDFSELPDDEKAEVVREWVEAEAEFTFDLGVYPLFRFRLVKIAADKHLLAFSVHHILCDGHSEQVLVYELGYWYDAFLQNPDTDVPETPLRYCDWAAWQKTYIGSLRYLRDLAWWRKNLAGAPPMLMVPTDKPRPPLGSTAGSWVLFDLEHELTQDLWNLGRANGATMYMVGLTLWSLVLRDYSGQDDIVVGTPVSSRNHPDLENLVGFFVNMVSLRVEFDRELTFADTLKAVSTRSLESLDHQHLPFEDVLDELGIKRDASYNPIFQAAFALEDALDMDEDDDDLGTSLKMKPLEHDTTTAMFDFTMTLRGQEEDYLAGELNYNTDLYEKATVERMVEHFQRLCKIVAANPEITIAELRSAASVDERSLSIGVGPTVEYPNDTTIHAVFAEQVAAHPDAIAVEHRDGKATYAELDAHAASIADALVAHDVGPGEIVAVEVPRGIPFLATTLAAMRTGAMYVPIDPEYPKERRAYMVEDSGARVVVRSVETEGVTSAQVIPVGPDELHLTVSESGRSIEPPLPGSSPVAYMIYTSGSTGRPKGAMVRHDGALNHIHAEVDLLDLADDFVFLQTAASSSDISVWQFLGPLVYGGRTVIVDTTTMLDARALFELIKSSGATIVELVPSVVQLLCGHVATLSPEERKLPALKCMMITGEAAPVPVVNEWLDLYPSVPMVNAYGPTEAADDVCQATISEPVGPDSRSVSIGHPVPNMSMFVLDPDLIPIPIGAAGEICVAGIGVGAGYHGQPERTAKSFVPNPYATGEHDKVLYRTGDLGRWRQDGQLDFLGRIDNQVKVRGLRIELGEITACIVTEDRVLEAATVLTDSDQGEPLLVGYYSTVDGEELTPEDLRNHLKTMLPKQIMPNMLVPLDQLPHLPNGKVDLNSLPKAQMAMVEVDDSDLGDVEREVREIWSELLSIAQLPLDANFFDWGGQSLMAVRMLARVRERFNKEVSVAEFFAGPTLNEFCAVLEATEESTDTIELTAAGKDRYPLSPGQARLWFLDLFDDDPTTYNMPGAIRMQGALDVDAFNRALTRIFARHSGLRTRIMVENAVPYQEILPAETVEIPVVDLSHLEPAEVLDAIRSRIFEMFSVPFQLDTAPLWRFELVKAGPEDYTLLSVAHHIITDGLSNDLIIQELITLYICEVEGIEEDPLQPIEYQYGDYAEWQLALQKTNGLRRQLLYWERKLAGAPALLDLPTDRPRPATQTYDGAEVDFSLDGDLVLALRKFADDNSATLFMVFHAAMAALLHIYSGQDDVVVGSPAGARRLVEFESIVGFFVNTLALRSKIDPSLGFDTLLAETRVNAIEAFDNRDVPFEQIVDRVSSDRNPSFSPVFQVMVAYEENTQRSAELPGLKVDAVTFDETIAMFDLDVLFDDDGDEEIDCMIKYNIDLFDRSTIDRLARHLNNLLRAVVADPTAPLGELDVTDSADHEDLALLEQGPEVSWAHDSTLVSRFEDQVAVRGDAVAATDGAHTLTYADVDSESAWLASLLVEHGVRPGSFVAIMSDRSVDFAVAIMAVLRAGGAYVPVDPGYPPARVTHMLTDSAAEVVITTETHLEAVLECAGEGLDRLIVVLPTRAMAAELEPVAVEPIADASADPEPVVVESVADAAADPEPVAVAAADPEPVANAAADPEPVAAEPVADAEAALVAEPAAAAAAAAAANGTAAADADAADEDTATPGEDTADEDTAETDASPAVAVDVIKAELQVPVGCTLLRLERPEDRPEETTVAPTVSVTPTAPAYMIYTSGSTGMPKGAQIDHRGQLNHILAEAELLELDETTVIAQTAPSSSDISVWQFIGPLVLGGTTAIVPTEDLLHADRLLQRIINDKVTVLELVPALFEHLLDHVDTLEPADRTNAIDALCGLSAAMITGEAAPVPVVNRWIETVPGVPVINAYGPTEASDDVCQHRIDEPLPEGARSVPIGVPIPGMTLLVLDEESRRVPRGVRGEICVAGVGVGGGYWRRPELTSESFIPNPHATGEFDQVLYRTGDVGRWTTSGALEYLGRLDGQVNVLGMRIELGEIESAIVALPEVKEAAAIVTEGSPARIAVFWVPAAGSPDDDDLAEALRDTLPSHMVPRTWVQLDALPRSPIGKIDYQRLTLGAADAAFSAKEYIAPESDDEVTLTDIWAEVLDAEQVSLNSDFFELGGNSLLAVQTTRLIQMRFGVEMPLVDFFRSSSIEGMLTTIERLRHEAATAEDALDEVEV